MSLENALPLPSTDTESDVDDTEVETDTDSDESDDDDFEDVEAVQFMESIHHVLTEQDKELKKQQEHQEPREPQEPSLAKAAVEPVAVEIGDASAEHRTPHSDQFISAEGDAGADVAAQDRQTTDAAAARAQLVQELGNDRFCGALYILIESRNHTNTKTVTSNLLNNTCI
eukprot:COSAG02_NODE_6441_length_3567_cov_2.178777_1_plen_171_part_00